MIVKTPGFRRLSRYLSTEPTHPQWARHQEISRKACLVVQLFYVVVLVAFVEFVSSLQAYAAEPDGFTPMWPVFWVDSVGMGLAAKLLIPIYILVGVCTVMFWWSFWLRLACSILLLQYMSLYNSWGGLITATTRFSGSQFASSFSRTRSSLRF